MGFGRGFSGAPSRTGGGSTEYTTGIARGGTPDANGSYFEFAAPSDVPPLQWYTDQTTTPLTILKLFQSQVLRKKNNRKDFFKNSILFIVINIL